MTESRRERLLRAIEIAERHGNTLMARNIRTALNELDSAARDGRPEIGPKDVY